MQARLFNPNDDSTEDDNKKPGITVLIVDDSPMKMVGVFDALGIPTDLKRLAMNMLKSTDGGGVLSPNVDDMKVVIANDGELGVDLWEKHPPDLIVSDYKMIKMNGDVMIDRIFKKCREHNLTRDTGIPLFLPKIIFYTTESQDAQNELVAALTKTGLNERDYGIYNRDTFKEAVKDAVRLLLAPFGGRPRQT